MDTQPRSPLPVEEDAAPPETAGSPASPEPAGQPVEDTAGDEPLPEVDTARPAKKKGRLWRCLKTLLVGIAVVALILLGIDRYVIETTRTGVVSVDSLPDEAADAILVLGAYVHEDGRLSDMLADRMKVGISLYKGGAGKVLLLSGDGRTDAYNEPEAMKRYAMEQGVPEEDIVLDEAGLSTYDSVCRAAAMEEYDSLIVVSQTYHLYRALYVAEDVGVEAIGVSADLQYYWGQLKRELREVLARNKDFWLTIINSL